MKENNSHLDVTPFEKYLLTVVGVLVTLCLLIKFLGG